MKREFSLERVYVRALRWLGFAALMALPWVGALFALVLFTMRLTRQLLRLTRAMANATRKAGA